MARARDALDQARGVKAAGTAADVVPVASALPAIPPSPVLIAEEAAPLKRFDEPRNTTRPVGTAPSALPPAPSRPVVAAPVALPPLGAPIVESEPEIPAGIMPVSQPAGPASLAPRPAEAAVARPVLGSPAPSSQFGAAVPEQDAERPAASSVVAARSAKAPVPSWARVLVALLVVGVAAFVVFRVLRRKRAE